MPDVERPSATRIRAALASPWMPWFVTAIAVAMALPSLWAGLAIDDFAHRMVVENHLRPPWDLYRFLTGDSREVDLLMNDGFVPWWTLPQLRIAFCRPLSSVLLWVDYTVFADRPLLMHAHTLVWFAVAVLATTVLYRRIGGATWLAGISAILFALDDAHAMSICWLACRHALLSFGFGALTLVAFDAWRRQGRAWGRSATPLLLTASLCGGESGVATLAYLVAYAVFLDAAPWKRRLVSLTPVAAVLVLWRVAYALLGYGVSGSGFYTDPAVEPWVFAGQVLLRGPILLFGQWALPSVDLLSAATIGQTLAACVIAVLMLAGLAALLIPIIRRDRVAAFWTLGMVLSIPPCCATVPSDRLLWFVGLGAFGLMGRSVGPLCNAVATSTWSARRRIACRTMVVLGVVMHGIIPAITLPMRTRRLLPPPVSAQVRVKLPRDPSIAEQTLVIVNGPSMLNAAYVRAENERAGRPVPRGVRIIGPSVSAVTVRRTDDRTVSLTVEDGYLVHPFDLVYRSSTRSFTVGGRVELPDMSAEIQRVTSDGRPVQVGFRFDRSLDDPTMRFVGWENGFYETFSVPSVGGEVSFPAVRISLFPVEKRAERD